MMLNKEEAVSTCETKREALTFLQYVLTNSAVAALATRLAILSPEVLSTITMPAITCNGAVVGVTASTTGLFVGSEIISGFMSNALTFYGNIVCNWVSFRTCVAALPG